jgi:preprotein translocase subunit SecG
MITVLLTIHLMIAAAMIGVVLLQRSEGGALGIGGGGGGFMAGRGGSNLLTRATATLAACFFATSLLLSLLANRSDRPASIFDTPASAPAKSKPGDAPAAPAPSGGGILDKLGPPKAPSGPSVPQSK